MRAADSEYEAIDLGVVPEQVEPSAALRRHLPDGRWRHSLYLCHHLARVSSRGARLARVIVATSGFVHVCDDQGRIRRLVSLGDLERAFVSRAAASSRVLLKFHPIAQEPSILLELPERPDPRNDPRSAADKLWPIRVLSALRRPLAGGAPLPITISPRPLEPGTLNAALHGSLEKRTHRGYLSPAQKIRGAAAGLRLQQWAASQPPSPARDRGEGSSPRAPPAPSPSPPPPAAQHSPGHHPPVDMGAEELLVSAARAELRARQAETATAALWDRLLRTGVGCAAPLTQCAWHLRFTGLRATGLGLGAGPCACPSPESPFCPDDGMQHHDKRRHVSITVCIDADARSATVRESGGVVDWRSSERWRPFCISLPGAAEAQVAFGVSQVGTQGGVRRVNLPLLALLPRPETGVLEGETSAARLWHEGLPLDGGGTLHLRAACALHDPDFNPGGRRGGTPSSFAAAPLRERELGPLPATPLAASSPRAGETFLQLEERWRRQADAEPVIVRMPRAASTPAPSFRGNEARQCSTVSPVRPSLDGSVASDSTLPATAPLAETLGLGAALYSDDADLLAAYRRGRQSVSPAPA